MTTAYYFKIGQKTMEGFAEYLEVKTNTVQGTIESVISEVEANGTGGWQDEHSIVDFGTPSLDIDLPNSEAVFLIFEIENPGPDNPTHFEKNKALSTLRLKGFTKGAGNAAADAIKRTGTHPRNSSEPVWGWAEFSPVESRGNVMRNYRSADYGGHKVTRFPFVFNFVGTDSEVHPFINDIHHHHHAAKSTDKDNKTHGGIHPRDPANCACTPGGGG